MPSSTRESHSTDAPEGLTYRRLLWRRFMRDRVAMVGLWLIAGLFAVAIFAPLLTSGKPLLLRRDGDLSSPLLRDIVAPLESPEANLERVYNFVLVYLLAAGALIGVPMLALRLAARRVPRKALGMAAAALGVLVLIPFFTVQGRLDKTDYRALAATLDAEGRGWAVFPLIRYGPFEQPAPVYEAPTGEHLLGTDKVGRDVLARIVYGGRVSLSVGFVSVAIAVMIGVSIGASAAYFGGWIDLIVQRVIEIVMCFPTFLLILTIVAYLEKRSIFNIILAIGLTGWTGVARLVRGEVLRQKQMEYTAASRAAGSGHAWIIFRVLMPNSIAPVLVSATFGVAGAILTETGLSFLGFGVQAPMPSWGALLNQARAFPAGYWWLTTWPGVMIFLTVTLYNLVGEGLRDALDPRLRLQ